MGGRQARCGAELLLCPRVFGLCLVELSSSRGGLIDLYLWIIITLDSTG